MTHPIVNAIAGRLSLRPPQRRSLEILDRITEIAPPKKDVNVQSSLAAIAGEFPSVTDFEREFPSLCFALATGVGKTRLIGAFISYLHLAHSYNNFFVLAPNLTIYNKLHVDFTPNTPKYVFTGIAEFATEAPTIITGDNYEGMAGTIFDQLHRCKINVFNISKINSEVRGGRSPRIKRLSEYIGESYFDYLAGLPDLVLIMDESHRYRASAGVRAIKINKGFSELKQRAYTQIAGEPMLDYRHSPKDKSNMSRYLFTGFSRCLYSEEKFQSDSERTLAVILDRDGQRWFKPTRGQFQIVYKWAGEHPEYQPDFVAETADAIYMLEPKARNELNDPQVLAKRDVAVTWCKHAGDNAAKHGGKPWKYVLIPHDAISENMTIQGLADRFAVKS